MSYRTEYMTKKSRKQQKWLPGGKFETLEAAKRDCCYRLIAGVTHTQVWQDENPVYSNGVRWTAFYDLAVMDGNPFPEFYADTLEGVQNES